MDIVASKLAEKLGQQALLGRKRIQTKSWVYLGLGQPSQRFSLKETDNTDYMYYYFGHVCNRKIKQNVGM